MPELCATLLQSTLLCSTLHYATSFGTASYSAIQHTHTLRYTIQNGSTQPNQHTHKHSQHTPITPTPSSASQLPPPLHPNPIVRASSSAHTAPPRPRRPISRSAISLSPECQSSAHAAHPLHGLLSLPLQSPSNPLSSSPAAAISPSLSLPRFRFRFPSFVLFPVFIFVFVLFLFSFLSFSLYPFL